MEKNACVKDIPYRSDRQKKIIEFGVLAVWIGTTSSDISTSIC